MNFVSGCILPDSLIDALGSSFLLCMLNDSFTWSASPASGTIAALSERTKRLNNIWSFMVKSRSLQLLICHSDKTGNFLGSVIANISKHSIAGISMWSTGLIVHFSMTALDFKGSALLLVLHLAPGADMCSWSVPLNWRKEASSFGKCLVCFNPML